MSRFGDLSASNFGEFGADSQKDGSMNASMKGFLGESPVNSPEGKSSRRIGTDQCIIPLTIKKFVQTPEPSANSTFKANGKEASYVKLVGRVEKVNIQTTFNEYTISDGTGSVGVKLWKDMEENSESPKSTEINVGSYVIAVGRVQFFNSKRNLTVQKLLPVDDYNIITHHFCEVIYQHKLSLVTKKVDPNSLAASSNNSSSNVAEEPLSVFEENEHLTFEQKEVLNYFKKDQTESGPSIDQCIRALGHFSAVSIRKNINHLVLEGHLYGTIDDEHLKPT